MKPSHTSTNPENLVKNGPVDSEVTGCEFAPLKRNKVKTGVENIARSAARPSRLNKDK